MIRLGSLVAPARIGGTAARSDLAATPVLDAVILGSVPADKVLYVGTTLEIRRPGGLLVYSHSPLMRGRGNSTWTAPKKPFKVRSRDRLQRPFRFAASRDWALMADYNDQSYVRSTFGFELYRRATGRWAPQSRHVWLNWGGSDRGLYRFSETVDVQAGRVDIRKMVGGDITGNALTGPYFGETDGWPDEPHATSTGGTPFMWDSPKEPVVEQAAYFQTWFDAAETAILTGTPTEIASFIDLGTFVDWYLLMELVKNPDSAWFKSVKWMKDQDAPNGTGKALMQAPWDLDLSLGIVSGGHSTPATGWMTRNVERAGQGQVDYPNWFYHLWARWPAFQEACRARWASAYVPALNGMWDWYEQVTASIDPHISADRAIWFSGSAQPEIHTTAWIKTWLATRTAWITANL